MTPVEFARKIKKLEKAEIAARKAQAVRDRAQNRFDDAMNALRPMGEGYSDQWKAYCDATGKHYAYDFGDTLC